jgi:hypothetical protein
MYCILYKYGTANTWFLFGSYTYATQQAAIDAIAKSRRYEATSREYKVMQLVDVVECP